MLGQLKPNGLALIIDSGLPENIGREVRLVGCLGHLKAGDIITYPGTDSRALVCMPGTYWAVEGVNSSVARVARGVDGEHVVKREPRGGLHAACLMPLDDQDWMLDALVDGLLRDRRLRA